MDLQEEFNKLKSLNGQILQKLSENQTPQWLANLCFHTDQVAELTGFTEEVVRYKCRTKQWETTMQKGKYLIPYSQLVNHIKH
jgi:hypothetical protein